jgi:hypothetical protein
VHHRHFGKEYRCFSFESDGGELLAIRRPTICDGARRAYWQHQLHNQGLERRRASPLSSRCTDAARTRVSNAALVCVRVRNAFRPSTLAATLGKRLGQVAGLVYHVARAPSLRTGPLVNSVRQALYRSARGAPYVLRADPYRIPSLACLLYLATLRGYSVAGCGNHE